MAAGLMFEFKPILEVYEYICCEILVFKLVNYSQVGFKIGEDEFV